jgi:hypothetical protein
MNTKPDIQHRSSAFRTLPTCFAVLLLASLWLDAFSSFAATSEPPNRMSFQSYLTDDSGNPVGSGTPVNKKMIFRLFDTTTGGNIKWAEEQIVTVNNGSFSAILGEGSTVSTINHDLALAFTSADASDRYIEVFVSNTDNTSPQTLTPRLRVLPAAYAYLATFAKTAESLTQPTSNLAASSVATDKIADGAVTTAKIADAAVTSAKIADAVVTSAKIVDGTVATGDLADNSVTSAKIAAGQVANSELADNAVNSAKIANGSVDTADLADAAVSQAKIADGAVNSAKITNSSVDTADLKDGAVTVAKMARLFEFTSYSGDLSSQTADRDTNYSYADWFPCLVGFNFGNLDVDESGVNTGWRVSFNRPTNDTTWHLIVSGPTHNDHINYFVQVLWIPAGMVLEKPAN